jgi:succinate-semialdehyde dehydrogenase/glutarate-semialdehyde dehydrogenase
MTTLELVETAAFIDGLWIESETTFEVLNPADGSVIAEVADLGRQRDQGRHRGRPPRLPGLGRPDRQGTRGDPAQVVRPDAGPREALARLMTAEQGKPLAESRGEVVVRRGVHRLVRRRGQAGLRPLIPSPMPGKRLMSIKQPVGVCAAIAPWNFPIAMITRKVGPALASGCTVVVKPAAETPLCALAIARLAVEAGVPAGVLNVVTGKDSSAIGKALCDDARVRKLSFTGSTPVGKTLYAQCAGTMKKLSLELGGNAPFIVFDDADLEAAVDGAIASKYRNTGQTCVCANRLLVQSGIHDAFVARLTEKVAAMKVGPARARA